MKTRRGLSRPAGLTTYDKEMGVEQGPEEQGPEEQEPNELLTSESVIAFLGTLVIALQTVERSQPREGFEALFLRHLENLSKVPLRDLSSQARIDYGRILASFHKIRSIPDVVVFPDEPKVI